MKIIIETNENDVSLESNIVKTNIIEEIAGKIVRKLATGDIVYRLVDNQKYILITQEMYDRYCMGKIL